MLLEAFLMHTPVTSETLSRWFTPVGGIKSMYCMYGELLAGFWQKGQTQTSRNRKEKRKGPHKSATYFCVDIQYSYSS